MTNQKRTADIGHPSECSTPRCRRDYEVIVACAPDGFVCRRCADDLEPRKVHVEGVL